MAGAGPACLCDLRRACQTGCGLGSARHAAAKNRVQPRIPVHPRRHPRDDTLGILYTWQSNQEVEEEIAKGRTSLEERKGASESELRRSRCDILIGMTFSN